MEVNFQLPLDARVYCAFWRIPKPAGPGLSDTEIMRKLRTSAEVLERTWALACLHICVVTQKVTTQTIMFWVLKVIHYQKR